MQNGREDVSVLLSGVISPILYCSDGLFPFPNHVIFLYSCIYLCYTQIAPGAHGFILEHSHKLVYRERIHEENSICCIGIFAFIYI